jgi:hypothetical protein
LAEFGFLLGLGRDFWMTLTLLWPHTSHPSRSEFAFAIYFSANPQTTYKGWTVDLLKILIQDFT